VRASHRNTYILLLIALASNDSIDPMQEKLSELVHAVLLPILDSGNQILHGFVQQVAVNSLVGLLKHTLRGLYPCCEICLGRFVFALFKQVLAGFSHALFHTE
jgi:hypothetical protein